MALIKWLKELGAAHEDVYGTKVAYIGASTALGFNVPLGFVVTPEFYQRFVTVTNIRDKIENLTSIASYDDKEHLQLLANQIQKLIIETQMPSGMLSEIADYYETLSVLQEETSQTLLAPSEEIRAAVRTSVKFPGDDYEGKFGLFLNVRGKDKVAKAVQACWASRFTLKVLEKMNELGFDVADMALSVIVQRMVLGERSGNLNTGEGGNEINMQIHAFWGLADRSQSDITNSDTYLFDAEKRRMLKADIRKKKIEIVRDIDTYQFVIQELSPRKSESQVLDERHILELSSIAARMRKGLGHDVSIAWTFAKDKPFILEVRPLRRDKAVEENNDIIEQALKQHKDETDDANLVDSGDENISDESDEGIIGEYKEQRSEEPERTSSSMSAASIMQASREMAGHVMGQVLRALTVHLRARASMEEKNLGLIELLNRSHAPDKGILLTYIDEYEQFITGGDPVKPQNVSACIELCERIIGS